MRARLQKTTAKDDLDRIRERAGLEAYAGSTEPEALRREIFNERRRELFGEGQYYFDIVRNGYYREMLRGKFKTLTDEEVRNGALYTWVSSDAFEKNTLMKEFPFSILCAGLLVVMGYSWNVVRPRRWCDPACDFAVYLFWMIQSAKKARTSGDKLEAEEEALAEEEIKILPMWKCMVFIIGGMTRNKVRR